MPPEKLINYDNVYLCDAEGKPIGPFAMALGHIEQ